MIAVFYTYRIWMNNLLVIPSNFISHQNVKELFRQQEERLEY